MRIGSLFSGYGGLDMAVAGVTGGTTAWVSDIDKGANKILAHRYPEAPNLGDITAIDWANVEPVDILTGGFPCQDVSHAGKRAGMTTTTTIPAGRQACGCQWADHAFPCEASSPKGDVPARLDGDERAKAIKDLNKNDRKHPERNQPERVVRTATRSGLWSHMARAIDELRPRLVVAENVRGLLSAEAPGDVEPCAWCVGEAPTVNLRALGVVLADLADLGYDAQWVGLRAADVGACHGRFRVFLIAHPEGDAWRICDGDGRLVAHSDLVGYERGGSARGRRSGSADGGSGAVTLLPTPRAQEPGRTNVGYGKSLNEAITGTPQLLPTPAVNDMGAGKTVEDWDAWTDAMKAKHGNGNGHGPSLAIEAQRLLPTPGASAGEKGRATGQDPAPRRAAGKQVELADIACFETDRIFGDYAPAIARWENVIGRPAPSPTEPTGKGGAHRLSPRFVEWMMGLPAGWVTDVPGLTRNEALKALGNGVVPQQAVAALRHMLAMERAA